MLAVAAVVLTATAALRGGEYDEQYTLFVTAGVARPVWPTGVFTAGDVQRLQTGHASLAGIARDLRNTDVHPPLYFWVVAIWRSIVGSGLFAARLASVVFTLVALAAVGVIASFAEVPVVLAMALTLGCYGFAYTGIIARGFALAQMLTLLGVALLIGAERSRRRRAALLGGTLLGAATFANYLAVFVAVAALAWLAGASSPRKRRSSVRAPLFAAGAFAIWLPMDLWFFLAQRDSRTGQFPPFQMLPSLARLAQYLAANLFGGLPLYVTGTAQIALGVALSLVLAAVVALIAGRWRRIATPGTRLLFTMAAAAPPIGLLLLGIVFANTPIELRYLAFATPFIALLVTGGLGTLQKRLRYTTIMALLAVQCAALVGLATRQETMQPARATAMAAATLAQHGIVLLPRGNDGAAIVGSFAIEAPPALRLLVIDRTDTAATIRARIVPARRVTLALIAQDAASRTTVAAMQAAFATPCWRRIADRFNVTTFERICDGE
jgi:uncharacterized membrane protein